MSRLYTNEAPCDVDVTPRCIALLVELLDCLTMQRHAVATVRAIALDISRYRASVGQHYLRLEAGGREASRHFAMVYVTYHCPQVSPQSSVVICNVIVLSRVSQLHCGYQREAIST